MLIILWDVKEPTHYSYKSRVIPVLWLSFVCERGVGEVGHLVGDLGVLLCPFRLGNKSCPVKWNKSKGAESRIGRKGDSIKTEREKTVFLLFNLLHTTCDSSFATEQVG